MPEVKGVAFDLDGTLFDSSSVSREALEEGFRIFWEEMGESGRVPSWEEAAGLIGLPSSAFYPAILPAPYRDEWRRLNGLVAEAEIVRLQAGEGRTYEGVQETLEALKARKYWLGCLSNATKPYFDAVLDYCGLRVYFAETVWLGEENRPTKMSVLSEWDNRLGGGGVLVYVGDRGADVEAGHAAGLPVVGVRYGFGTPDELDNADLTIGSLPHILPCLENMRD